MPHMRCLTDARDARQPQPVKPDVTINAQHRGWGYEQLMNKLVACLETLTVYLVIAGALIGSALGAVDQFYPLY